MIVDTTTSELKTIGQVEQIKAYIDPKNIEYIATILSANLYSKPIESCVRELAANAWDSHVEAHNEGKPVLVEFTESSITIRDYGTGLSKEDFESLYCSIGSSTKRSSNSFIGKWGLGHLSPLSYSNIVYIHNIYNGVDSYYIMTKEANSIVTSLVSTTNTEDQNGLSITIPFKSHYDRSDFEDAVSKLCLMPNLYVKYYSNSPSGRNINDAKVVKYNNFIVCDKVNYFTINVTFGNLLYPLDMSLFSNQRDKLTVLKNICAILPFNIGDLDITPSREAIQYTDNSKEKIAEAIDKAYEEVQECIRKATAKDFTDIRTLFKECSDYYRYWDPLKNTLEALNSGIAVREDGLNYSYKGNPINSSDIRNIRAMKHNTISQDYIKAMYGRYGITSISAKTTIPNSYNHMTCDIVVIQGYKSITPAVRALYDDPMNAFSFLCTEFPEEELNNICRTSIEILNNDIVADIKSRITYITKEDIDKYKRANKKATKNSTPCNVFGFLGGTEFSGTLYDCMENMAKNRNSVYLVFRGRDKSTSDNHFYEIYSKINRCVWVSAPIYDKLVIEKKKLSKHYSNIITVDELLYRRVPTAIQYEYVLSKFKFNRNDVIFPIVLLLWSKGGKDLHKSYMSLISNEITTYKQKALQEEYPDMKITSLKAIELQETLTRAFSLYNSDEYARLRNICVSSDFMSFNGSINRYILCRLMLKHGINVDYSNYNTYKSSNLIKLLK